MTDEEKIALKVACLRAVATLLAGKSGIRAQMGPGTRAALPRHINQLSLDREHFERCRLPTH
jgi:hypothetical protein